MLSRRLEEQQRPATTAEQPTLARWSSWGAIPQVFDESKADWARERAQLQSLLSDDAYAEARRTTINAHYTDPAYVREIWGALEGLGFTGGDVLEPGSGSGTFIGMAPEGVSMTGIELDSTTASIARGLYPQADIRTESFADTRYPRGHFDAAVGNVPFADVTLHDSAFNQGGHSMHNHFIIKSLALTRPGGMVAVLTSSFTMDAVNPAARREMNGMADLVGAVRLPTGAFRRSAGTEALTDLLILRKREPGQTKADDLWETVTARRVDGELIKTNAYFDVHPEHVLGEFHVGTGMYGNATVSVRGQLDETPQRFHDALDDIVGRAEERGATFSTRTAESVQERAANVAEQTDLWDGTIVAQSDNQFTIVRDGRHTPLTVPRSQGPELRALLGLRDGARALLEAEAANVDDTAEIGALRADLHRDYDAYVERYGALNRYTLRSTGREDPDTGEMRMSRNTPRPAVTLRQDPFGPLVMALERFDEETQGSTPASLLSQRVVAPRASVQGAETPSEAIALSLNESGSVDLEGIAYLLGQEPDEARAALGTLVYDDPATGQLIHAPEYLSGNVRIKLEAAEAAVADNPDLQTNIDALREVIPDPIGIEEIEAKLGAVWIDPETHRQFLAETLNDSTVRVENPLPGEWEVRGQRFGVKATNEWGTDRRPAVDIAQSVMEQKPVLVHDEIDDGEKKRKVLNGVETTAAQEKGDALQERFSAWVWEDPDRANRLGNEYNRRFNSIVLRDYTKAGDYLTLPGLASNFVPRDHQRGAVARIVAEPAVGLFHQVGAGKTAEMVMGSMELKRMGLINKPAVVIPNHMLEQFSREWMQLYPQARILAASSDDLAGDKRRLFVARAAANDWDAVIMTQTAFKKMALSPEFEGQYIEGQVAELRDVLDNAKAEDAMSVKRIEKRVLKLEEDQKFLLDQPRDPGITFESSGIDYLMVDEMHMYKNLDTPSNIPGAAIDGSKQAGDLHMKLEYLRAQHGERVVTGATATPLSNSVTEAFIMQRFLRPDLLEQAGIRSFDSWAATFGKSVTEMEMGPAGGFRLKSRFAKFQNVPEMLRMWHVFADVKTAEDLKLPVPLVRQRESDGQRQHETIVLEPTAELQEYISAVADRAEAVANRTVTPEEDNMLKISTDGRKAALDIRLVDPTQEPTGRVKLDAVASRILQEWNATRDNTYVDDVTGDESPVTGGLQLVFSDIGTPNPTRWNAYDELRMKLIDGGMPAESIRFIHEAKNDSEKARMFAAGRAGHIAVLMGSTAKMGVGTNVQSRLTAMHHVDCPWRPSDIEQRDGRGIRQGNQNAEVGITRYVVERSFDAYSWQTVARKATFINQIMKGRLDSREIEDIGDSALSASEAKALASGNPLILEKATADSELQKLRRQETAYHRAESSLVHTKHRAGDEITRDEAAIGELREAMTRSVDVSGDNFRMTIADADYTSRAEAGDAIAQWARVQGVQYLSTYNTRDMALGSVGGHDVVVRPVPPLSLTNGSGRVDIEVSLADVPYSASRLPVSEFLGGGVGVVRQIENKTTAPPRIIEALEKNIAEKERTLHDIEARLGKPFAHADELAAAQARSDDVNARLAAHAQDNSASPTTAAPDESGPSAGVSAAAVEAAQLDAATFPVNDGTAPRGNPAPRPRHSTPEPERDDGRER